MSFGMRVFGPGGVMVMDTTTFTYQVFWTGSVDFSVGTAPFRQITLDIPGFNPANCVFVCIPYRPQDLNPLTPGASAYPYVAVQVGRVVLSSNHPVFGTTALTQTRGVFRGYAIRHKL